MISGRSDSIRLTTGFGGFMPSHSLVPVTAPRLGRDRKSFRIYGSMSLGRKYEREKTFR